MGMIAAHFTLISVTLQTSSDATELIGDSPYLRDIAAGLRRGLRERNRV
jgi:hypothetical protein